MTPMTKTVLYYGYLRVSTKKQASRKGKVHKDISLSQETQLQIIQDYVHSKGGKLVGYEVEVESGTNPDRAVLRRVTNTCKINNFALITARMDRLHRNVEAMSKLMNSNIDFVFCDFPQANRLTIHIMSAIAEYQASNTKKLINDTIANKRKMKIPMGNHINSRKALNENRDQKKAIAVKQDKAYFNESNIDAGNTVVDKRNIGWTLQRIADHLNAMGKLTRNGKAFTSMTVKLLYDRYSAIPIESQLQKRNSVISAVIV